jgi:hypothetical protein
MTVTAAIPVLLRGADASPDRDVDVGSGVDDPVGLEVGFEGLEEVLESV